MSDPTPSAAERIEAALAAVVIAVAVVGATLLPLTSPLFVRTLVVAVEADRFTGLDTEATLRAAESVRRFVLDTDAPPLPSELHGKPAFDEAASSHLVDVRNVLVPARTLALVLAVCAVLWAAVRGRSGRGRRVLGTALGTAGWILVSVAGVGVLAGLIDFDSFFAWFHSLFFAPGTWQFPDTALLIRIFPLPFWVASGASWGVLVLASCGVLNRAGRRLRFTRGTYGV